MPSDGGRLVLLQEVLGGDQPRLDAQRPLDRAAAFLTESRIAVSPELPERSPMPCM